MSKMVISGSDVTFGLLEELMKQLKANANDPSKGISGAQLRAFLEHRNPFDQGEIEKVLPYADEETLSCLRYPKEFGFMGIGYQAENLQGIFPHLKGFDPEQVVRYICNTMPKCGEAWAAIPKPDKIAENYYEAFQTVLKEISQRLSFSNLLEGKLEHNSLRLPSKGGTELLQMSSVLEGDFFLIPYQFGMRHGGKSNRRARVCFTANEFGLGPYEAAILLLIYPARLNNSELNILCSGCDYDYDLSSEYSFCISFRYENELLLDCVKNDEVQYNFGAVSGFKPAESEFRLREHE